MIYIYIYYASTPHILSSNSTKDFLAKKAISYRKFILAGIRPANRKALGQITRSLRACRNCMLNSAVLFPALSQIMLFVDGMNGVVNHNETVQWLYTLSGSLVSDGDTNMHTKASVNTNHKRAFVTLGPCSFSGCIFS